MAGKNLPLDDEGLNFTLAHPGLIGDISEVRPAPLWPAHASRRPHPARRLRQPWQPVRRARRRSRQRYALRLALDPSATRILRKLLTEAILISLAGGVIGLAGGVLILTCSAPGSPFRCPHQRSVNPTFALTWSRSALARKRIPMRIMPVRRSCAPIHGRSFAPA